MPAPNQPIRIRQDDLHSPSVEESLQQQAHLGRDVGEMAPQSWLVRTLFSSWFYLSVTSGLGAFVAWMILEPFFDDSLAGQDDVEIVNLLLSQPWPDSSDCFWELPKESCAAMQAVP